MIYGIKTALARMLKNPEAEKILAEELPFYERIISEKGNLSRSVEQLSETYGFSSIVSGIGEKLSGLNTPENMVNEEERRLMEAFRKIDEGDKASAAVSELHHQNSIEPGKTWLDTDGKPIQAHGGAVFYWNGWYYWYGENKEHTDTKNGVWTWGMRMYRSKDLCNWESLGIVVPPVIDNPNSFFFPTMKLDRPHLLRCPATGMFVMWMKVCGPEASFAVLQSEKIDGPYTVVREFYCPFGHRVGDFDLVMDDKSGKAYVYFDADHNSVMCMELSSDYLEAVREVNSSYRNLKSPFTREGIALFEKDGRKFMFTSSMSGYIPNKSDSASASSWEDEFVSLGNPHIDDETNASFNSQITKVFRIEGTDRFVAMADRWISYIHIDARLSDIVFRVSAADHKSADVKVTDQERKEALSIDNMERVNTSIATYVWLPVQWKDGKPVIRWYDEWKPQISVVNK
ncbi:MAG: family 43 glycosylhydrolase [Sphaerochaetaceae bacterium]|nr:family 43 glycosylhydrolase [Sphaerochaetaceae bacterium]